MWFDCLISLPMTKLENSVSIFHGLDELLFQMHSVLTKLIIKVS